MKIVKIDFCTEAAIRRLSLTSEPTVVIYGRAGCGKTYNAERLARFFGLSVVVDGWDGGHLPPTGILALADDIRQAKEAGHKVFEFHQAMALRESMLALQGIAAIA